MLPISRTRSRLGAAATAWCVLLVFAAGCSRKATPGADPTAEWFRDNERKLVMLRTLVVMDGGDVTSMSRNETGALTSAAGAKGSCASSVPSGAFPWSCTGGSKVSDVRGVESFLGIPSGRLGQYADAMAPRSFREGDACVPPGSFHFTVVDPKEAACSGTHDVVWSPSPPPPTPTAGCTRTAPMRYAPLGGGFYAVPCP
ncbi:MAG: hypothetical protein U0169_01970 [Polyangiaceae bacterium]